MNNTLSITELLTHLNKRIPLQLPSTPSVKPTLIDIEAAKQGKAPILGGLNLIHKNQIQLIGQAERDYLLSLDSKEYHSTLHWLFSQHPALIFLLESVTLNQQFHLNATKHSIPVATTTASNYDVTTELRYIISHKMADKTTVHGVFMEVAGMGLLLSGQPGIGKSELALELISRGHRLVADDVAEFAQLSPKTLRGRCPELLQDFLEVRGLGILNIRQMFGDNAIKPSKNLRLVVELTPWNEKHIQESSRLDDTYRHKKILSIDIPTVKIPVAPGRNLAVLVEAAARNHLLREHGYNSSQDLQNKLSKKLTEGNK